jgi:hypothetical protein
MNARKFLVGVLVVAIAVVGLVGWREKRATRATQAARIALQQELAGLEAQVKKSDERATTIDRDLSERQSELAALKKQLAAKVPSAPAAPVKRFGPILELIRHDPEAEARYLENQRANLAATYGPFFRSRGLSPEHVAKFGRIFLQREEARMDLADVLRSQGEEASGKAVATLKAKAEADYGAGLRELLGETGYAQLQDYERSSWMRQMVSAVAGVAVLEHAPFSAQQADELVGIIAGASKRYQQGGSATDDDIDWDAVLLQAKAILTAEQFAIMTTMDPGPSHGGLMQRRMYALVEQVKQAAGMRGAPASGGGK